MKREELNNRYFEWMWHLVCNDEFSKNLSYRKLLTHLHEIEFTYIIDKDGNRASDGIDLRYQFGYYCHYENAVIAAYLDDRPCSVLEMMIALSVRCENIMEDPEQGDRVGMWFWNMIVNLGLGSMTDDRFDANYIDEVIFRLLNREYDPDGEGGLFVIKNCEKDLRTVEIWYQLWWYLNEIM